MTWTDARIAELARLWTAGISASGIAEALGEVSRSAVLGKLHRLRLLKSRKAASAPRRYGTPTTPPATGGAPTWRPAGVSSAGPPEPPRSPWREEVFAPLPASTPRPWLLREPGECAFPVAGDGDAVLSCCAAAQPASSYCPSHHRIVFRAISPAARAAEQRRWAKQADAWSGAAAVDVAAVRSAA